MFYSEVFLYKIKNKKINIKNKYLSYKEQKENQKFYFVKENIHFVLCSFSRLFEPIHRVPIYLKLYIDID